MTVVNAMMDIITMKMNVNNVILLVERVQSVRITALHVLVIRCLIISNVSARLGHIVTMRNCSNVEYAIKAVLNAMVL